MNTAWNLYDAVQKGQTAKIKRLVKEGVDLNAKFGKYQEAPLHVCAYKGDIETVSLLLQNHADINVKDKWRKTPLHHACENKQIDVARILVENGASINCQNEDHQTPLHISSGRGFEEITRFLLETGEATKDLKDTWGQTAVFLAAQNNHYNVAKLLKEYGADVTIPNMDFKSPVFIATERRYHNIVKVLLGQEHKLDMDENIEHMMPP